MGTFAPHHLKYAFQILSFNAQLAPNKQPSLTSDWGRTGLNKIAWMEAANTLSQMNPISILLSGGERAVGSALCLLRGPKHIWAIGSVISEEGSAGVYLY